MRSAPITYLCILLVLASCKTTQKIFPEQSALPVDTVQKGLLRGFLIQEKDWISADADAMNLKIQDIIKDYSQANYNMIVFSCNESTSFAECQPVEYQSIDYKQNAGSCDPLLVAIEAAHQNGLKIYAGVDLFKQLQRHLLQKVDSSTNKSVYKLADIELGQITTESTRAPKLIDMLLSDVTFPQIKTIMKRNIGTFIKLYDIDGLQIDITSLLDSIELIHHQKEVLINSENLSKEGGKDNLVQIRIKDLLEDLVVEIMLVKPYLVNSLVFSAGKDPLIPFSCMEEGIIDFISPIFGGGEERSVDAFFEFFKEKIRSHDLATYIIPTFIIGSGEDIQIIKHYDKLIFPAVSTGFFMKSNLVDRLAAAAPLLSELYPGRKEGPISLKTIGSDQAVGLNLSALLRGTISGQEVKLLNDTKYKITDSEGVIGVIIPAALDTIDLRTTDMSMILNAARWSVPYKYKVYPGQEAVREPPWVEFRKMPSKHTLNPEYHLLCKTNYPASAFIDGNSVKVYKTGIFFDKIKLKEGSNRIRATIMTPDSLMSFYEEEFFYEKVDKSESVFPLWIDEHTISPSEDLEFLPEDMIRIDFHGSRGQQAFVEIYPAGLLVECNRMDYNDYSRYYTNIPARKLMNGDYQQLILRIVASADTVDNQVLSLPLPNRIVIKQLDEFPLVRVMQANSRLTYNTGPIRLGGPIRAELNPGVILQADGKEGDYYRIRLNEIEKGYIHQENVEIMPPETVRPNYYITSISCYPTERGDIVSIPYSEPVPYEVYCEPDQKRIAITLFGVKTSSTWITHRQGRRVVDRITWQQTSPETYQVYVNLNTSKIWGYDIQVQGNQLLMQVRYPPETVPSIEKPLTGLKIAIEAGHGGESTGAEGLSGLLEKDINLDLALKLGKICQDKGAEVVQVRPSDTTMLLIDKREIALSSNANMLISIHANAAGVNRGYLGVPGTSTYYNNPFWAPLAESIYDRLLDLGLAEFGVVGSFNYTVIRVSQMPSILVEQAFMTHAEDEEKLADQHFRQQMAQKIYEGIMNFLTFMGEGQ